MDVAGEIEKTFKIPRTVLAFLAIIFGILILIFREVLPILVGSFLIIWGLMEAVNMGGTPTGPSKTG